MPDPEAFVLGKFEDAPPGHRSGFVAMLGKPNVGKSTLLNALLGQKIAIVSDKPQTTRRRIRGVLTRPEAQIVFVDTPGIYLPRHRLGQAMVQAAVQSIPDADVLVFLVDAAGLPDAADRRIADLIRERGQARPVILTLNKMDRLKPEQVKEHAEAYWSLAPTPAGGQPPAPWAWMMISALDGGNLDKLTARIVERLPAGPRYYPPDQVTDLQERDIAAELIREQALRRLRQEVPHAVAVVIDEYKERSASLDYVAATVVVEKESQKGILIGKGGHTLRQIGADARLEIERLVDKQVFLELQVKVRRNWREDERELRRMGYSTDDR
jgi:GTP-binding protein Era